MGKTSSSIKEDMIRQVLTETGKPISGFDKVPGTFYFDKAPIDFKLKVFKRILEEIIRKLEEHDDYQTFPKDSLAAIQRGLNDTRKGFYALLASRIKIDIKRKIENVLPFLLQAQGFVLEATTLLDEQGKRQEYYLALLKCYEKMFQIKLLLRAWKV